jgi:hypothetical protein
MKYGATLSMHNPNIKPHVRNITQASLKAIAGKGKCKGRGSGTTTRKKSDMYE